MKKISSQTISVWGGTGTEQSLVRSMMSLLAGRTDQQWAMGDDASCGLVLAGKAASEVEHAPFPAKTGPRVLAMLLSQDDPEVGGVALSIRRPIRVMPLIELLNEAGKRLAEQALDAPEFVRTQPILAPAPSEPSVPAAGSHLLVAAVLSVLRKNAKNSVPTVLLDKSGQCIAVVHGGPGTVKASLPMNELINRLAQTFSESRPLDLMPHAVAALKDPPLQSLDALCWKVGATLADSVGLAPWLKSDGVYRLLGWPDFGAIGADRYGMKLSPAMLATPMSPIQLSEKTRISLRDVASFFNSVSVSGLLSEAVDSAPRPAPASIPSVNAPRRSMFSMLRSKLGLS